MNLLPSAAPHCDLCDVMMLGPVRFLEDNMICDGCYALLTGTTQDCEDRHRPWRPGPAAGDETSKTAAAK